MDCLDCGRPMVQSEVHDSYWRCVCGAGFMTGTPTYQSTCKCGAEAHVDVDLDNPNRFFIKCDACGKEGWYTIQERDDG